MDQITLKNFRCFRERQTARLAPLTLLVGENSTGKTSFLALVRALMDLALGSPVPDFKREPYDLGSFDEIVHHRGGRSGRVATFEAGFDTDSLIDRGRPGQNGSYCFSADFEKRGTVPFPVRRRFSHGDVWIEVHSDSTGSGVLRVGTRRGSWEKKIPHRISVWIDRNAAQTPPLLLFLAILGSEVDRTINDQLTPLSGSSTPTYEDRNSLNELAFDFPETAHSLFAGAPVRSKPRRTYDPAHVILDPEGDYVPMYLADLYSRGEQEWTVLKNGLERFGSAAGLFDEISIKRLGKRGSEPFQVQVRKGGTRLKGPPRNLIDVGYGVSQALPVITELLRPDALSMFLLQQPEVHLHPRAQAALGSLFCQVASPERQLIIETHSDHLIDRVRMDVRDGDSALKPEDVSILFFERTDLDVRIHSIRIDEEGNIVGAPDSYGSFFMEETSRSIWKRRKSTVG